MSLIPTILCGGTGSWLWPLSRELHPKPFIRLAEADERGNRVEGKAILHDVSGCYICSSERVVGAVDVGNLLIIDTPDVLLVVDKALAQDVKHIYRQLKELGHDAYKLHWLVHRPWGTYTVIEEGPSYKTKHRLSNRTAEPLVMIEVQSGGYLGEDDIVRFDDAYGRALAVAG